MSQNRPELWAKGKRPTSEKMIACNVENIAPQNYYWGVMTEQSPRTEAVKEWEKYTSYLSHWRSQVTRRN